MRCHGSPRARSGVVVPRVRHDASAMRGGRRGGGRETREGEKGGDYNTRIPRTSIPSSVLSLRYAGHAENPWEMGFTTSPTGLGDTF